MDFICWLSAAASRLARPIRKTLEILSEVQVNRLPGGRDEGEDLLASAPFPFHQLFRGKSGTETETGTETGKAQDVVGMSLRTTISCGIFLNTARLGAEAPEMNVSV